jgi:hypothetical protein
MCIDLDKDKYSLVDFFDLGSDQPMKPEDLEMKFVYLLVFNKRSKEYECISISLDPWGKEAFPEVMKLFVF